MEGDPDLTAQENNPLPRELAAGVWWLGQCYEIPFMGKLVHNNNAVFLVAGTEYSALVETGIPGTPSCSSGSSTR